MKKIFYFFIFSIIFYSCDKEITDEITDPAAVNVIYELIKSTDDSGNSLEYIRAMVFSDAFVMYDKIKEGGITFNNAELPFNVQTRTYYLETSLMPDSLYTFRLTLSNGKTYTSSVRTPAAMFGSVYTHPGTYSISENLQVEWSETLTGSQVNFMLSGIPFNATEAVALYETVLEDEGSVTVTPSNIPSQYITGGVTNASIKLARIVEGEKAEAFASEDIYVQFTYAKKLEMDSK